MKKALLIFFAAVFLAAPALIIYSSVKSSSAIMQAENEKQLLQLMQNELQREDIARNPIIEIYRKFFMVLRRTQDNEFYNENESEANDALLNFIKQLMQEATSMWFAGESTMIYKRNGQDHRINVASGKESQSGILDELTLALRRVKLTSNAKKFLDEIKATSLRHITRCLKLYFNIAIFFDKESDEIIQRSVVRESNSLKLYILLRLRGTMLLNFVTDLSRIDANEEAKHKIADWRHTDMGLVLLDSKNQVQVTASSFFDDKPAMLKSIVRLINNRSHQRTVCKWQNHLILISNYDPKKQHRTAIVAKAPQMPREPLALYLVIFFSLLGCSTFKLLVEGVIFARGIVVSIKMFILTIFILVTMLPLLSSAYLANEYVTANFKIEKSRAIRDLTDELLSLDIKTLVNFRTSVNLARSLDSIEKIAEVADMPASTPANELLLNAMRRLKSRYGRPLFSKVSIYNESQPFSIILYDQDRNEYTYGDNGKNLAGEMFLNRYRDYMRRYSAKTENQQPEKAADKIEFDVLKSELLDNFLLNAFGEQTYYKMREDFGALIKQESFMDTNSMLTTLVSSQGQIKYIFTWIYESNGVRDLFPVESLRIDEDNPLLAVFGNEQDIGARPIQFNELNKKFPKLVELGNQSLVTGSRLFMQDYTASGSPIFEARPAKYSDFIMCGSRPTRDLNSITGELATNALHYFALIAGSGLILALFTSLYFTIPVRQLIKATQQVTDGNYNVRLDPRHPDEFAFAAATFNKMATGLQQGELLNSFVSESVKELATREEFTGSDIAFNTNATVLFSSIKDFQAIQANNEPEKIFEILQMHLSASVTAVACHGGEIDKMIEDRVMIVFAGRQKSESEQARAAVSVALSIKQEMERGGLTTAAGITSGEVVSGVIGASNVRLSKTVVGDTVNLAARLAAMAISLPKTDIVAAGNIIGCLPGDYVCTKLPISQVKGKSRSVEAYSVKPADA